MDNPVVIGVISWFLPGVGHLMQGKVLRGAIIAAVVWSMFIIAILSGGAHYPGFDFKDGTLLYLLNIFAKTGVIMQYKDTYISSDNIWTDKRVDLKYRIL